MKFDGYVFGSLRESGVVGAAQLLCFQKGSVKGCGSSTMFPNLKRSWKFDSLMGAQGNAGCILGTRQDARLATNMT